MKTSKFICLMVVTIVTMRVWAVEPPEAVNLHHRNGSITSTAFAAFSHISFSGDTLRIVGANEPVAVELEDISKITFDSLQLPQIPVTFATSGEGSGSLSAYVMENGQQGQALTSGDEVKAGDTVLFSAKAEAGSRVKGWKVNGAYTADTTSKKSVRMDETLHADGLRVEVEFEKEAVVIVRIPVTFATSGEGSGSLSAYVMENGQQGQALTSGEEVKAGDTVLFSAKAEAGSLVKGWKVNGAYTADTTSKKSVRMDETLHADGLRVEVEFEKEAAVIATIPVTFATSGEGSGSLSAYVMENGQPGQALTSGDEVKAGDTVFFSAKAEAGSRVKGWKVNGAYTADTTSKKTIRMDETLHADGLNVEVEFEKEAVVIVTIPVTFATTGEGSGILSAYVMENGRPGQALASGEEVKAGDTVFFSAKAEAGSRVKGWKVNGAYTADTTSKKTIRMDETLHADGLNVEVEFEKEAAVIVTIPVTFATTGEGSGSLSAHVIENGQQGQALNSGDEVEAGDTVLFSAKAEAGSRVKGWKVNGAYTADTTSKKTIRMDETLHADGLNVEVEFEKEAVVIVTIPVTFATTGEGSGSLSAYVMENGQQGQALSSGDEVEVGTTVKFKAVPETGSEVKGWRVNGKYTEESASEKTVLLDKDLYADGLNVEVEFEKKVGIEESSEYSLKVYVRNREIVVESAAGIERVEVMDMGGSLLRKGIYRQAHHALLPAGELRTGVYIVRVRTTEGEEIRKVIIR